MYLLKIGHHAQHKGHKLTNGIHFRPWDLYLLLRNNCWMMMAWHASSRRLRRPLANLDWLERPVLEKNGQLKRLKVMKGSVDKLALALNQCWEWHI